MATDEYRKLDYKWKDYERDVKQVAASTSELTYDPFVANPAEGQKLWQRFGADKSTSFDTELFLLPREFNLLSIEMVLNPKEIPKCPQLPKAPPIVLGKSEYPPWYLDNRVVNHSSLYERDITHRQSQLEKAAKIQVLIDEKTNEFNAVRELAKNECDQIKGSLGAGDISAIERTIALSHARHPLPEFLRGDYRVAIDSSGQIALIEFKFPDYASKALVVGRGEKYPYKPKFATETQRKKYVKQCLFSLIIRSAYLAANLCIKEVCKIVAVNVEQDWFDPATGTPRSGLIASLEAPVDYLRSLDLSKLDPGACFRHLKGISTPSLQRISPIRPIFVLNKMDDRIVSGKEIDAELEPETNLAAMPWEDFEHLVAQLFEWEFGRKGIEVKVTRASRDRGVDAILFDPDPLRGGKYVLQAKRYTRTVDVSAVRDLYGTLMNEGANRGILITTSSYGPDAYEFAKDKPISLVDGPNLLVMLQKHGKKYRIDLIEARRLNGE